MAARTPTLRSQVEALTEVVAALAARLPAQGAPAQAKAESPFVAFLHERAASKVACEIHAPGTCNRKFTPVSRGRQSHVARIDS